MVPSAEITIYEAARTPLAKVAVSGGGRCNLTNSFADVKSLAKVYPRGEKLMQRAFKIFDFNRTYDWFEQCGVRLMTQEDECVFPESQDSREIIDTFRRMIYELDVELRCSSRVERIEKLEDGLFSITLNDDSTVQSEIVIVTTGGSPTLGGLKMLESLPLEYEKPVPSLFSLNIADPALRDMMGVVVPDAVLALRGTKIKAQGALLITHWGISGPATLRLSSYAARVLNERDYRAMIAINWTGEVDENIVKAELERIALEHEKKMIGNIRPYNLTSRVWSHIISRAGLPSDRRWSELGRKGINALVVKLASDEHNIAGKSTHKEEFVTCGGVSLQSVEMSSLESKECDGLYFAGEVLDIDAVTGGFNLQAAWSTAYLVAYSIAKRDSLVF